MSRWFPLSPALAAVALLTACQDTPYVAPADGPLEAALREASAESGVPRDLLAAIAWSESRLDDRDGEIDKFGRVGVMGLRSAGTSGPTFAAAAEALGVTEDAVRNDLRLQVRGAAAILRGYAEVEVGYVPEDVESWGPMLGRWSGFGSEKLQESYRREIYGFLEHGFIHRTPDGERIELIGRNLIGMGDPADLRHTSDYGGAADFDVAASCNYSDYSRGDGDIDYIIIHTVQGSYAGCISWFQDCDAGASAHYVVRSSDGEVTQMVDEEDVAWHAGNWDYNLRSIGIEHEGYVSSSKYYTDAMYRGSAALVRDIADRYGIPKDRDHIIAHSEVPDPDGSGYGGSGGHTDPGAYWDWDYFMSLVNETAPPEVSDPTGDLTGYVRADDIYSGAAITGAKVELSNGASTTTDSTGRYVFYGLEPATYTVSVSASGYDATSASKSVTADVLNWKSLALVSSGSGTDGGTDGGTSTTAAPGVPTGLYPNGHTITTSSLTLSWSDQGATATLHEVEIEWWDGDEWKYYYTYNPAGTSKTIWPYVKNTKYRFAVRGYNESGGWGDWSGWATWTQK